jgi:hypothetical protein
MSLVLLICVLVICALIVFLARQIFAAQPQVVKIVQITVAVLLLLWLIYEIGVLHHFPTL